MSTNGKIFYAGEVERPAVMDVLLEVRLPGPDRQRRPSGFAHVRIRDFEALMMEARLLDGE